jgi:hypothetical protein
MITDDGFINHPVHARGDNRVNAKSDLNLMSGLTPVLQGTEIVAPAAMDFRAELNGISLARTLGENYLKHFASARCS